MSLSWLESVFVRGLMLFGAVATILTCLALFMLLRPYNLLQVEGTPVLLNVPADGSYEPGDVVEWSRPLICNYGTGTQSNRRWIEYQTGVAFELSSTEFPQPPGELPVCVADNVTRYVIPADVVRDGQWRFRTEISYQPNPIRTVSLTVYSPWITVEQPKE